jgi:hypothetical protein
MSNCLRLQNNSDLLHKYLHSNNYPNLFTQNSNKEIKIKYKQIIIIKRVWVKITVVSMKMDTCRQVWVDDSTMCA